MYLVPYPANIKHLYNIYTILDQRLRRCQILYTCHTNVLCLLGSVHAVKRLVFFLANIPADKLTQCLVIIMIIGPAFTAGEPALHQRRINIIVSAAVSHILIDLGNTSQQTQNICITFIQCWPNIEDVGPALFKCYTNMLCLLGWYKNV